jgi:hypothetical protein
MLLPNYIYLRLWHDIKEIGKIIPADYETAKRLIVSLIEELNEKYGSS